MDLMKSQDPWFMGVTLAYGPDGSVFVSDWSDTGAAAPQDDGDGEVTVHVRAGDIPVARIMAGR